MDDIRWYFYYLTGGDQLKNAACVMSRLKDESGKNMINLAVNILVIVISDLNYIRAEGFVFSHVGDEGPIHSCAADIIRYRKELGAEHIQVFTDIKKKHRYVRRQWKLI